PRAESRGHERPRSCAVSIVEEPRAGKNRGGSEDQFLEVGQDAGAWLGEFPLAERLRRVFGERGGCGRSRGVHRATRKPPPSSQLSRGIPEAAGRARNCLRRAVRLGLKSIVPPLQGSGIGLGPVDLAPKGRNNEAQANGLGLNYPPIFTPSPEGAK